MQTSPTSIWYTDASKMLTEKYLTLSSKRLHFPWQSPYTGTRTLIPTPARSMLRWLHKSCTYTPFFLSFPSLSHSGLRRPVVLPCFPTNKQRTGQKMLTRFYGQLNQTCFFHSLSSILPHPRCPLMLICSSTIFFCSICPA